MKILQALRHLDNAIDFKNLGYNEAWQTLKPLYSLNRRQTNKVQAMSYSGHPCIIGGIIKRYTLLSTEVSRHTFLNTLYAIHSRFSMDSIGAKCDDVMRVSPAGKTSSCQTGRAENTMEPRVYSVQQLKAEIAAMLLKWKHCCELGQDWYEVESTDFEKLRQTISHLANVGGKRSAEMQITSTMRAALEAIQASGVIISSSRRSLVGGRKRVLYVNRSSVDFSRSFKIHKVARRKARLVSSGSRTPPTTNKHMPQGRGKWNCTGEVRCVVKKYPAVVLYRLFDGSRATLRLVNMQSYAT